MKLDIKIQGEIAKVLPEVTAFRRAVHEAPDLSENEGPTCARISAILSAHGITHETMLGGTAICAAVGSHAAGKTVALRADIDALPLTERTNLPFASRRPGAMHACGHDIHAAVALGAALALKSVESELPGCVKIFFQPAEETTGGAARMIEAGCLESPRVDNVLGLHVDPSLPTGSAAFKYGKMHAASDEFTIVLHGRGCHGAHPEEGCDAIAMAGQLVAALQNIASRNISPVNSAVVTVGKITGGTKGNIIADRVELEGIMRSLDEKTRLLLRRRVEETARGIAAAFGGAAELLLRPSYAALINDDATTDTAARAARETIGAASVTVKTEPTLGTEDFSYFAAARPSCFYELGCATPGRENAPLHSAEFEANESCIETGIKLQTAAALALLES